MNTDATEAALGLLGLSPQNAVPLVPLKRKQPTTEPHNPDIITNPEAINCICGFLYDDGFSIACDDCSRWCHAACFDIVEGGVPEEWRCWVCVPRPVDRERAVKLQKARQKQAQDVARKVSPGVERRSRQRASASAIEGSKKKRRASINVSVQPQQPSHSHPPPPTPSAEDEHVDIDEPWTHSYVPITKDIIPHQDTRDKLRRQAQHWRGVTALQPSPLSGYPVPLPEHALPAPTTIHPLPSHPPAVRPPSYALHTTAPVPSSHFIAPYTSTITPSAAYLADPLNSYAHLGMPKPFVHLMGPPLDVALDARITGDESRFVRSGCRPNAVLRPVVCEQKKESTASLSFGVFALRDLKANEEIVLGWEWDDGNAIHSLPALIESPHAFPPPPPPHTHHSSAQLNHLRNQMSGILHALTSTFTTCACGSSAKDCALTQMAAFVDGEALGPPNGGQVDLGPLVGTERGFRTREKVPFSGGMSGVEMDLPSLAGPSSRSPPERRNTVHDVANAFRAGNAKKGDRSKTLSPEDRKTIPLPVLTLSPATASPTPKKDWKGKARAYGERPGEDDGSTDESSGVEGSANLVSRRGGERTKRARRQVMIDCSPLNSPRHTRRHQVHPEEAMQSVEEEEDEQTTREEEEGAGDGEETKMPLKMRKRWMHQTKDTFWGLGNSASPSGSPASPGSASAVSGRGPDRGGSSDDTTSGDASMESERMEVDEATPDPKEMPPPSMPAALDPTTISSTHVVAHDAQVSPSTSFANLSLLSPVIRGPSPSSLSSYPFPSNRSTTSPVPPPPPPPPPLHRPRSSSPRRDTEPKLTLTPPPVSTPISPTEPEPLEEHLAPAPEPQPTPHNEQPPSYPPSVIDSPLSGPLDPNPHRVRFASPEALASLSPLGNVQSVDSPPAEHRDSPIQSAPSSPPAEEVELTVPTVSEAEEQPPSTPIEPPKPHTEEVPPQVDRVASSPPPQKVKLSLKDFALRKKKQREEKMAKSTSPPPPASNGRGTPPPSPQLNSGDVDMDVARGLTEMKAEDLKVVDVIMQDATENPAPTEENIKTESPPHAAHIDHPPANGTFTNGLIHQDEHMSDPVPPVPRERSFSPPKPSPRQITPQSPPSHPNRHSKSYTIEPVVDYPDSLQAKVELLDEPIPNGLVSADAHTPNSASFSPEPLPPPLNEAEAKVTLPTPPLGNDYQESARRSSQEDGEIVPATTPPKQPSFVPRSHTPPTQPRSFHATTPTSPSLVSTPPPSSQPRRPSQSQASYRAPQPNSNIASRPLPSGPRALRAASVTTHSPAAYPTTRSSFSGPQYIPRGPSADRDRLEWERERGWTRTRGRGSGSGWAR